MADQKANIATNREKTLLAVRQSDDEIRKVKVNDDDELLIAGGGEAEGTPGDPSPTIAVQVGGLARNTQPAAVDEDDLVKYTLSLYGETVDASYDWTNEANRTSEIDPLDEKYLNNSIDTDTTNVTATTHYYPGATGAVIDGYQDHSLTGKFIDADGTLTLSLEVSNDEVAASADWNPIYFYDDFGNAIVNTLTVTNGTLLFSVSLNDLNFRRYRWVVTADGATNTVILKGRNKAL